MLPSITRQRPRICSATWNYSQRNPALTPSRMRKQGSRGDAEGGGNAKIICIGFYSRGFASFAGKGGFAADLGRFGETTLPFFSIGTDALPP